MDCKPSKTKEFIDIPAMKEKYRQERDKRMRSERQDQYAHAAGELAAYHEVDPYTPVVPRAPISQDIDVAIIGAGFTGLFVGARLKETGVNTFRIIDLAGDFGGAWYWNRYPGIQCDNDAYCYMPMLEDTNYVPSKRFADGSEIHQHCQRIAKKFGLYENALFQTEIRGMRWDEGIKRWRLSTSRGDDIRARFVVFGLGPHGRLKLPGIPGIKDFKGHSFHSARWDYAYSGGTQDNPVLDKLADKRVAVIGTGASSIQIVPYVSKYAKHLYVFQRTPSSVDERPNPPTDPAWRNSLKPGWQKARQVNFRHGVEGFAPGEPDLICDFWTEINRNIQARMEAKGWPKLTPQEYGAMHELEDFRVMDRLRSRVDAIVKDSKVAESLKPYYRFMCKRPLSNDEYYPAFNRPNVTLVDVSATRGVERITENGVVGGGVEYPVDCIVYASGFESGGKLRDRFGIDVIEGTNGLSLYDFWANGYKTFHGMMAHGFPNQFHTGYTQAATSANVTEMYQQQSVHIAHVIKEALAQGIVKLEPSREAQDAWVKLVKEGTMDLSQFLKECTPSYFSSEGKEGVTGFLGGDAYGPGFEAFDQLLKEWRDKGDMAGLIQTRA